MAKLKELSKLSPARALGAVAVEWLCIAGTFAVLESVWHPLLYLLAIVWIGARQHALVVIGHDAVHFRFLPNKTWNDFIGSLLCQWPLFLTLGAFRHVHGRHHRHLGTPDDANRWAWRTHDASGQLKAEWTYPKSRLGIAWVVTRRALGPTGVMWILRSIPAAILFRGSPFQLMGRIVFTLATIAILTALGLWSRFLLYWIVPFCTWHMAAQYVRLICEHSAIPSDNGPYALTRTTLLPVWQRWLVLPRNINYHIEHHFYPSVPFYNLPALHELMQEQPGFQSSAVVTHSIGESLSQCLR